MNYTIGAYWIKIITYDYVWNWKVQLHLIYTKLPGKILKK